MYPHFLPKLAPPPHDEETPPWSAWTLNLYNHPWGGPQCRQEQEKDVESESLEVKSPFSVSSIHTDDGMEEPRNSQSVWVSSLLYNLLADDLTLVTKSVRAQVFSFSIMVYNRILNIVSCAIW